MGYFVETIAANFIIKKENLEDAYKALCQLNAKDDLKGGGIWGSNLPVFIKPQSSVSVSTNPDRWFFRLDWNYDETCKSVKEILESLDFYTSITREGDLSIDAFYNDRGDEKHFLKAVAPFVEDGSFIEWMDEDGNIWKNVFNNGKMENKYANVS